MATIERTSITDFYERDVLPALSRRLDQAFPEFSWQRDARGWHATNQEFTHATLGVRADRVICHGDAPRGFLVHGQGPVLWTSYVNNGHPARGGEFVEAVRNLAERAGIESERLDRPPTTTERKAVLLHDAFALCQRELASDRGGVARDYLERRGIPAASGEQANLGVMPDRERIRLTLLSGGYSEPEISASGLLADTRWPGRVVGAWRDEHKRVTTLWARATNDDPDRYLYLRGAPRAGAIPYGLSDILTNHTRDDHPELMLVEGVMDVHVLRAHGIREVAALGGATPSSDLLERLADTGLQRLVLAFDNDAAGHATTARSVDLAMRASRSPEIRIVDPDLLHTAKDPGELVQTGGVDLWRQASAAPVCGVTWRALDLAGRTSTNGRELSRRDGLARASSWLAELPARLAIEQTDALGTVADSLGYDRDAVHRAFRARYWNREHVIEQSAGRGLSR